MHDRRHGGGTRASSGDIFYRYDLASAFHLHRSKGNEDPKLRFIVTGDRWLTLGRLALIRAVASVIANVLAIIGVEPVEEMK